jgi:hypothetical protein
MGPYLTNIRRSSTSIAFLQFVSFFDIKGLTYSHSSGKDSLDTRYISLNLSEYLDKSCETANVPYVETFSTIR